MKEVQTSKNLYLTIYKLLKQGIRPSVIEKELGLKKQRINYYISYFKQRGIIRKLGYGVWEITLELTDSEIIEEVKKRSTKKSSIGVNTNIPKTNLHALNIKMPILSGGINGDGWIKKNTLKNWSPTYKKFPQLGGFTIKNNNNKSINIFSHSRNLKNIEDTYDLAFKLRAYVYGLFKNKYRVELDIFNTETKNLNLATENKDINDMVSKGECFKMDLDKQAEKIFGKDKMKAWASLDNSPFKPSVETNDLEWKRLYLQMPLFIRDLVQNNIDSTKVIKEVSERQMDLSMVLKQVSDNMIHLTKIIIENFKDST